MKTLVEIKKRALEIAQTHFYADVDDLTPWEPFEGYSDDWIQWEIDNMADMLVRNMLWAQGLQLIFAETDNVAKA
jgi:hypothetical protein